MRIHQLKNYLKLGILLFGISVILTNCQKDDGFYNDDLSIIKPDLTLKKINFEEFLKQRNSGTIIEKLNKLNRKRSNQSYNNSKSSDGTPQTITIDSSSIKQITKGGTVSYTFIIIKDTISTTNFENLIIQTDSLQQTSAYIIKYIPETVYDIDTSFYGTREVTLLDSDVNINNSNSKTVACVTVTTLIHHYLCDEGVEQNPENCDYQYTSESSVTSCTTIGDSNGGQTYIMGDDYSTGGGGGGSNGNGNPPNDPLDPPILTSPNNTLPTINEKNLNALTENPQIKAKIIELKGKTTEDREYGYQFNISGNNPVTYNIDEGTLAPDSNGIKFPPASVFTQLEIHTHHDGLTDGLQNAFSASDLYNMAKLSVDSNNPDATAILVAPNGKLYALKVTDQTKADAFKILNEQQGENKMKTEYKNRVIYYARLKCNGTCTITEFYDLINNYLVWYLNHMNSGLTLYEATEDSNGDITWNRVIYTP